MKNRKTVVVAFLLVAAMLLSVGYAAMTDVLYVNGTLNVSDADVQNAYDQEVYFANEAKSTTGTGTGTDTISIGADADGGANDKVTFAVNSLKVVGEKATFTFDIVNENAFAVNVVLANTFASDYFDVSITDVTTVAATGTAAVTVVVTLVEVPASGDAVAETFEVTYTATSVETT